MPTANAKEGAVNVDQELRVDRNRGIAAAINYGSQTNYYSSTAENANETHARYRDMILMSDPQLDREQLRSEKGERAGGTCEWVKTNNAFKSWLENGYSLLYIVGGPGRGKTMLSIYLTEELERVRTKDEEVIFFFSMHENDKRNTAVAVLRGFIYLILRKRPQLTDLIADEMKDKKRSEMVLSSPEALWSLLRAIVRDTRTPISYCVLDGLDECDNESIRFLQRKFLELDSSGSANSRDCKLKLVVVSRELDGFPGVARIRLNELEMETFRDLERLISSRLEKFRVEVLGDERLLDENERENIQNQLIKRAEGIFLWAGFILDEMSRKTSMRALLKTLKSFPPGLPAVYDRMLQQIAESDTGICANILQWVALATRPLNVKELAYAIGISGAQDISAEDMVADEIAKCSPLVHVQGEKVSFVHQSARDYLLRPEVETDESLKLFQFKPSLGHRNLAIICLARLRDSPLNDSKYADPELDTYEDPKALIRHFEGSPLLEYAIMYWHEHVRGAAWRFSEAHQSLPDFFGADSVLQKNWMRVRAEPNWSRQDYRDLRMEVAVRYDMVWWAKVLIADQTSQPWTKSLRNGFIDYANQIIEQGDDFHDYAVSVVPVTFSIMGRLMKRPHRFAEETERAVRLGRREMVQLLLDSGVSVDQEDEDGESLLMIAVDSRWSNSLEKIGIIKLLMERGAKLSGKRVAAAKISQLGHIAQMEPQAHLAVCIEHHLESTVERQDVDSYIWLLRAVRARDLELVSNLLDAGVPMANIKPKQYHRYSEFNLCGSALEDACSLDGMANACSEETLELVAALLAAKTVRTKNNPNDRNSFKELMTRAVRYRDLRLLKIFLDHGVDVNAKGTGNSGSLLDECMECDGSLFSAEVANLLLDRGASSDTALHTAAEAGNVEGLELLLSRGYNLDHRSDRHDKWTPLEIAIRFSYRNERAVDIVTLLLDRGATMPDSALHDSIKNEDLALITFLLSHGFDANKQVEYQGEEMRSSLEYACWNYDPVSWIFSTRRSENIVSELLKNGARSERALHITIEKGNIRLLKLLLAHGFSSDRRIKYTKRGGEITPLEYARSTKNQEAVNVLLSYRG